MLVGHKKCILNIHWGKKEGIKSPEKQYCDSRINDE